MQTSALLTDLYQLTMAYGFWKNNLYNRRAVFHLFFRENPFKGGYTIACGLNQVVEFLDNLSFTNEELGYLSTLKDQSGQPMFDEGFLKYLSQLSFTCDVHAVPEGTIVFPHEPLLRVTGPIIQCQLVESALLTFINFQSLIATKAARIVLATKGDPIMEFGLRRAQGMDGALSAARAAYIGGVAGTSNVLAAKQYNIPALGTHAHSWVQAFDEEQTAFDTFADTMPGNTVLLVDTYNTATGIDHAIKTAQRMLANGYQINGIRLDSGDLAYLSQLARRKLNEAGLPFMKIVASNDLDEHLITSLKQQEAPIDIWGVGTKLVTAFDQPALGGVYKLSAIETKPNQWEDRIKLSEQSVKVNIPGFQQVKRFFKDNDFCCDMIYDERDTLPSQTVIIDPADPVRTKTIDLTTTHSTDLLIPIIKNGIFIGAQESVQQLQDRTKEGLSLLDKTHRRLVNPHIYPVGLEQQLYKRRMDLILFYKKKYLS
jgi:nicotinate phosphoribosyltransferase